MSFLDDYFKSRDNTSDEFSGVGNWWANRDPTVTNAPHDTAAAQGYLDKVTGAYDGITPPTLSNVDMQGPQAAPDAVASQVGPSAMGGITVNPDYNKAQMAQLAALSDLAAHGGKNAATEANLAEIEQQENANARGQRGAIMQGMDRRGMGSSGANLLAQLSSSQNATDAQSARDRGVAAQEANTMLAAGQGAAGIGAGMESQAFGEAASKAAAADAVNRFNAANTTGVSEFNANKNQGVNNMTAAAHNQGQMINNVEIPQTSFQDTMGIAGGKANAAHAGVDYWGNKYKEDKAAGGGMMSGILGLGGSIGGAMIGRGGGGGGAAAGGAGGGGGTGGYAGADTAGDFANYAWRGGKVPGVAAVSGDSPLNDFVPVMSSPGEVHVPRSLATHGTKEQIGDFVQHAPPIGGSDKKREAMLSALKHLHRNGRV